MADCVLNLSCAYAGGLLGVLLFLFFVCIGVFYVERYHLERLAKQENDEYPGNEKVDKGTAYRESYLQQAPSTVLANSAQSSALVTGTKQGVAFSQRSPALGPRDVGSLHPGYEVSVLALEGGGHWCGQWSGGKGWFNTAQSSNSSLKVMPGDRITVESIARDHWTGYCRGLHGTFPLPHLLADETSPGRGSGPAPQSYVSGGSAPHLYTAGGSEAAPVPPMQPPAPQITQPLPPQAAQPPPPPPQAEESRMYQFA